VAGGWLDLPGLGQAVTGQPYGRALRMAILLVAALAAVSGCSQGSSVPVGAQPSPTPSVYPLGQPSVEAATSGDDSGRSVAQFVKQSNGTTLPDKKATPGNVYPDVRQADICDLHYVLGVRQPRFNDKVEAFANYGVSIHDRDFFQVDHLIPVSLGGTNAMTNLWPQPYAGSHGAAAKDLVERQLRGLVCSHKLSLKVAQQAIAKNWWTAYDRYMGLPIDPGSAGLEPWSPPPTAAAGGEVSNGAPCTTAGKVGYTDNKHIALTCTAGSDGQLHWAKRY
jgi:hypothetical protein